jgi:hypothetical protein
MSKFKTMGVLVAVASCLATAACIDNGGMGDGSGAPNADGHTGPCATLTVALTDSGAGAVTSDPAGIDCTGGSNGCWASYAQGTVVTLNATVMKGWRFVEWSGDCSGTTPTATVTLDTNKNCDARYAPVYPDSSDGGAPADGGSSYGDGGGTSDDGSVSMGGDSWTCCAPAGSNVAAGCIYGDQCCLPITALECANGGGVWMAASSCSTSPPSC